MSSSVHTIRARREDITEYRRAMACLTALIAQWETLRQTSSHGDALKVEQIRRRYEEMAQFGHNIIRHSAQAFADLAAQVPDMVTFIREDIRQMQESMIEEQTSQRRQLRQRVEQAAVLCDLLRQRMPAETALIAHLERLTQGEEDDGSAAEALNQALRALIATEAPTSVLTERQRELAQRLQEPVPDAAESVAGLPEADPRSAEQRLRRIERHIAELAVLAPQMDIRAFTQRAAQLNTLPQDARWETLSDSLILALARSTRQARAVAEGCTELAMLIAGLESFTEVDATAIAEAQAALTSGSLASIAAAIERLRDATDRAQRDVAARARREAVLDGLAHLGYEVHDEMASAWLHDGNVVLRKPATPGYGLELGGGAESARFQIRAVALSAQRDSARDADIESIWCGEHQQLQQLLAQTGNDLTIDRALPPGAAPLKVIEMDGESTVRQQGAKQTRER